MPYRSRSQDEIAARAETGLVADMVRQFADPYAFVRELVQNGIDASATELAVRAEMRHDGGVALSVRDDGVGMTREIIEGPLLTLFNSEKDQQQGKIGKYGIGFVSVFAVEPREVIVETWRSEGSWQLTLRPDHSYELATGADKSGSGTQVTLVIPPGDGDMEIHGHRMHAALVKWCRHARIPIQWTRQTHGEPIERERIDRPLEVTSPVVVEAETRGAHIIVGGSPGDDRDGSNELELADSFIGFYNHGLTLHETDAPPEDDLVGLRVKILSDSLQHTLSRDDVRRDRAYHRAIDDAIELSRGPLRTKLIAELKDAAATVAAGGDGRHYEQLLTIALRKPLSLSAKEVRVPLVEAIDGRHTMLAHECRWDNGRYARADRSSLATRTLASQGKPVVIANLASTNISLQLLFGGALTDVDVLVSVLPPVKLDGTAAALCAATRDALNATGTRIDVVELGECEGVTARAAVAAEQGTVVLLDRTAWPDWYANRRGGSIRLIAGHQAVSKALAMAERTSVKAAAALLARYLLVEARGEVSASDGEMLLMASLGADE